MTAKYRPVPSILSARPRTFIEHIGLTKDHALAARREAERAESSGASERAVQLWTLALTIEPSVQSAWQGLARGLRALGRAHEAENIERRPLTLGKAS